MSLDIGDTESVTCLNFSGRQEDCHRPSSTIVSGEHGDVTGQRGVG